MPISAQGLGYFFSTTDRASPGIKKLNQNVKELGDASEIAQQKYDRSMKLIRQGTKEALIGGLGIKVINDLTKSYGTFEMSLASAGAVMNASSGQMRQLERAAIDAGIATQFSPHEAVQGLENLGAAGMNAKQAIATLNPVLNLAAASLGQLGVGEAASNVVGVLNAFGDTTDMATKRVDQLVKITQMSNFQARDFSVALSQAAAQAKAADQSFESMTATLGLLRNTNLDASSAATAYREAVRRVSGEEQAQKKLKKLGIETLDKQTGKIKDLGRIMTEVIPAMSKLDAKQRNLNLKVIFGVRGMKTYNAFLASYNKLVKEGKIATGDYAGAHRLLVEGLNSAGGTAEKTRDKLLATAEGQRILLKGSMETFKVVAGKALIPVVLPAIKAITSALNTVIGVLDSLSPGMRTFISHFVGVGAVMMAASGAIKILVGVRGLIGLSKAAAVATTSSTALAASQASVAASTNAANAAMAKQTGFQRMSSGFGNLVSRAASWLPVAGIVVSGITAISAWRKKADDDAMKRAKQARAEQAATRQAYINTIDVVKHLGDVAEKAGNKLVESAKKNRKVAEDSLGIVRDKIVANLTTAQKKEREMLEVGRKLRAGLYSGEEKKRMQQRMLQLRQDVLVSEERAKRFAVAEMKIRAEQAKRIPAFKRTEEQNRDIVTANTFQISKMRQNEVALEKKISETRNVFQTKGIIKRRQQLEKQLAKMKQAREKFTLDTARLTGYTGKKAGEAAKAVRGFAGPRLAELEQFGGIESRTGLERSSLFAIARGTAAPGLMASRTPEQRAAIEEWIRTVADPEGKYTKARGRAAVMTGEGQAFGAGPTAAGQGATDVFSRVGMGVESAHAAASMPMVYTIVEALKVVFKETKLQVSIDGQDVPTENKNRSERTAKGKPSKPAK